MAAVEPAFVILLLFSTAYCHLDFSDGARNFSMELLHYTLNETSRNLVVSPIGLWGLMTGLSIGATGNSHLELTKSLRVPKENEKILEGYKNLTNRVLDPIDEWVTIKNNDFMFLDFKFNITPNFDEIMTEDFGVSIDYLDFKDPSKAMILANRIIINAGANFSDVLRCTDFLHSKIILTNIITFKGSWSTAFDTKDTVLEPFYNENSEEIGKVNMMSQQSYFQYSNIPEMKSRVLELLYNNKYYMLLLLPYPRVTVRDVYRTLETWTLPRILERLKNETDKFDLELVKVLLPRFKISAHHLMKNRLEQMGVHDVFDPAVASLKGVTRDDAFVSAIVQKAEIEVTESGAKVAAELGVFPGDRFPVTVFHANKPFLYFVIEKPTATVLFSGVYSDPIIY